MVWRKHFSCKHVQTTFDQIHLLKSSFSAEILYCTLAHTRPRWKFLTPVAETLFSRTYDLDKQSQHLYETLGSALQDFSFPTQYRTTISLMKLVTILVDHYQRRGSPEFAHIITVRNHAQHFLVSLGPSDHTLVEVCRISLLIYADMIIFSLPASTRLRIRLVTMLVQALGLDDSDSFTAFQLRLHNSRLQNERTLWSGLVLWATAIGAVAIEHTESLRSHLIHVIKPLLAALDFSDLARFRTVLQRYMWWDYVCGPPMVDLWWELQEKT